MHRNHSENSTPIRENDVPVCCVLGNYYRHREQYIADNSNFTKFFKELKKLSIFDTTIVDLTTQCAFVVAFHNEKIVPRGTHQLNGEIEEEYHPINVNMIVTHFLEHTDNTFKDINTEIITCGIVLKHLMRPKNWMVKRKGILTLRKNVTDGIVKTQKMRNENLKIRILLKEKNM